MKKLCLVMSILLVLTCFSGCKGGSKNIIQRDYDFSSNPIKMGVKDGFSYILYEDHSKIVAYDKATTAYEIAIPFEFEGKPVAVIGADVFMGNDYVKSITIPDTVTDIENYAFFRCSSLKDVVIPTSVKRIGCDAFAKTPWFSSLDKEFVTVGDGVLIKYNGQDESVALPKSVKYVSTAFKDNAIISEVMFHSEVFGISDNAFYGCGSITEDILPDDFKNIGIYAFHNSGWHLGSDGEFLIAGDNVLVEYTGAEENVVIPEGVKSIAGAFYGNSTVKNVVIPASVESVSKNAFFNCKALETVEFLGDSAVIGENAFSESASLKSVVLPSQLKAISNNLFYGATKLQNIEIPKTVGYIGSSSFYGCASIESLELPESISVIGDHAFFGCEKLSNVKMPKTVSFMGVAVFGCCYELKSVELPENLTVLPEATFSCCFGLRSINLSQNIKTVSKFSFEKCENLEVIVNGVDTVFEVNSFSGMGKGIKFKIKKGSKAESFVEQSKISYTFF